MNETKAILIVNLGTPLKPARREVRRYLTAFLNDRRVIDLPWLFRKLLVNLVIIPFRVGKSTRLYRRLWTKEGSPMQVHFASLVKKLQQHLTGRYKVVAAMRYGRPSLLSALRQIREMHVEKMLILPLFPQYASSTTGSVLEKVMNEIKTWDAIPEMRLIGQFYDHPEFISAFTKQIMKYEPAGYDHVVFSYHGLPYRHIRKIHPGCDGENCTCSTSMPLCGTLCYKATCYETTRLLAKELNIPIDRFSVGFQSRLAENWISPFTDELLIGLAKKGVRKVLVVAPSFVSDCLETLVEIGWEYQSVFKRHGGECLTLVESLNDSDNWVYAISNIIGPYNTKLDK